MILRVVAALAVVAGLLPGTTAATDFLWNAVLPADWNTATNWSPPTSVPGGGGNSADTATILNGGTATITASPPAIAEIDLGESGSSLLTNTVNHSAGTVTVNNALALGLLLPGAGVYNQSGGIVDIGAAGAGGSLIIGEDAGTGGTYNLTGGTLNASIAGQDSYIGESGSGTVTQSGNSVANFQQNAPADGSALYLGFLSGSTGQYTLGGTATLHAFHDEYIGLQGNGTFTQTGGTHTIERVLDMADQPTSTSSYSMQGGTLTVKSSVLVGSSGHATFTESGGTVNAGDDLDIAAFSGSGVYNLRGGTLNVNGGPSGSGSGLIFSAAGIGTFNFTGGTLRVREYSLSGNLAQSASTAASTLDATANDTAIDVPYTLNGAGNGASLLVGNNHLLTVHGQLSVLGGAVTITQTSGAISADDFISIANGTANGTFNLSGGTVSFGTLGFSVADQGGTGILNLSGTGTINASATDDVYVGKSLNAVGTANQTGGALHIRSGGALYLTNAATASGTYNLKGGLLDASSGTITKGAGNGTLNVTGGTLRVATIAADMLDITQDAKDAASTLDVTSNSSTVNVNYTAAVSAGPNIATINVGSGQSLSMASGKSLTFGNQSMLQGAGNITGGAGAGFVYGSNLSSVFSGTIGGSMLVAKTGAGILTLSGPNACTVVSGGTLATTAAGSLGAATGSLTINAVGGGGSTLNLGNNQTVSSLSGTLSGVGSTATLNITAGASLTVNQPGVTSFAGTLANSGLFTKTGGGALEIDGPPNLAAGSNIQVSAGTLRFNVTNGAANVGSGVQASVADGATLELAGSVSALSSTAAVADRVAIGNNSLAPSGGLLVSGANQQVGSIDGTGNTLLAAAASLMANHVRQNTLIIGGEPNQLSILTIVVSDAGGNPMAEPTTIVSASSSIITAPLANRGLARNLESPTDARLASLPEPPALLLAVCAVAVLAWPALRRRWL